MPTNIKSNERSKLRMRTLYSMLVCLLSLALLAGCIVENSISEPNQKRLAEAISSKVPGVFMVDAVAQGDGFNTSYSAEVTVRAPQVRRRDDARRVARAVSRVAWRTMEVSSNQIEVRVKLPGLSESECPDPAVLNCHLVRVSVPTDAARRLWGESQAGDRSDSDGGRTFAPRRSGKLNKDWDLYTGVVYEQELRFTVLPPDDVPADEHTLRPVADTVARQLWHDHPDHLTGIKVEFVTFDVTGGSDRIILIIEYSAERLRKRFGKRAPDLRR